MLNSKSEFNHCKIPRFVIKEQDHDKLQKLEEMRELNTKYTLDQEQQAWKHGRWRQRAKEHRDTLSKEKGRNRNKEQETRSK